MQIHFWTADIDRAIKFYTEVLGFTLTYSQPAEGPLDFCILHLDDQQVMFGTPPAELIEMNRNDRPLLEAVNGRIGQAGPLSIYFAVSDVDAHFAHTVENGVTILEPLWQTPWGLKQYSLQDIDGQLLTFHNRGS